MNGRAVGVRKLRSIRALLGPAVIVSVAYIDPGNFGSNISAGAKFGMSLLWVVWLSGFLAILFQYLSGKLGLARGYSVFEEMMLRIEGLGILSKPLKILYFTSTFIMILATDMAELTGMVVGIALLLNIPLEIALPIAFLDIIILFIALERAGRLHEIIAVLVGVVGFSLLYELHIVGVDFTEVIRSSITISSLSGEISIYATAIIGATIMPHALLLHSYLSRDEWRTQEDPSRALRKHLKDTLLYLSIASLLNAALQVLSYYAFYIHGIHDVDAETAYYILKPLYGALASYVFGIALLASGLSSSLVSIQVGVNIFESFFSKHMSMWRVRFMIRIINLIPFTIAILIGFNVIELLVYTQVVLSIYLPLVLLPLTLITSSHRLMGSLRNSRIISALALIFSIVIILINAALLTIFSS